MWNRARQGYKILASGFLFTCLGIGGFIFTVLVWPVMALLPGGAEARKRRTMHLIHHCFSLFVVGLEGSGILKVRPQGLPSMASLGGCLILANHPSYLDIVVILARFPGAVCVVKEGVWRNPFYGPIVRAAGFVPILGAEEVLDEAEAALRKGLPLVIFPEGTRTRKDRALRFQRGAAHLALRTGAPILPLLIHVDPPLLEKGNRWYDVPIRTCQFHLRAEKVFPRGPEDPDPEPYTLQARRLTESLENFYQRKLDEFRNNDARG